MSFERPRRTNRDAAAMDGFSCAPLIRLENGHHRVQLAVPARLRGHWVEFRIEGWAQGDFGLLVLRFDVLVPPPDPWTGSIVATVQGAQPAVFGIPADATAFCADIFGLPAAAPLQVRIRQISRAAASVKLLAQSPSRARDLLQAGRGTPMRRVRSLLIELAAGLPRWLDYPTWIRAFDSWSEQDRDTLFASPDRAKWPSIFVLVDGTGATEAAIQATQTSLQSQWLTSASAPIVQESFSRLADLPRARHEDYVAVLQAGEILPPQALAVFADQAAKAERPGALYADDDQIGANLQREYPHFKPDAGPLLLSSGLLTRGAWLFRRDLFAKSGALPLSSANMLRLALALRLTDEGKQPRILHIPFVLTHRRFDILPENSEELLPLASDFLARRQITADIDARSVPLRIRPRISDLQDKDSAPKVSIVIPSTARAPHVAGCLDGILHHTNYPHYEIIIVISQADPLDAMQEALLAPLRARGIVQVKWLPTDNFSFSRATNVGAAASDAALICLLNDDVVPLQDDWLSILVGHLRDPEVGIVGPKLLYPNGTVQHGGVIMGLGGGCAHAHRLLPKDAAGYGFRACLDQDLSGVTGACLVVRRELYERLGGLDESYPIAFNDIDFCLRAREAGFRVIYAASAQLLHHETITLGGHYEGERDGVGRQELKRMHASWGAVVAADPFHNPNLSLSMGHEWDLALPPRITRPFGLARVTRFS